MSQEEKKEYQELIPKELYQDSILRFKSEIDKSSQRINQGSEIGLEIITLGNLCQNEFESVGEKVDGIFKKWVEKEKSKQEIEINNKITEKDEEIEKLQTTVNELLNGLPKIQENIKIYDDQKKYIEEKIKKMKEQTKTINIQEMLMKEQVNDYLEILNEELNEIKEEIQQKEKNVSTEDVLNKIQYIYKIVIKSFAKNLESQYQRNLKDIPSQYIEKESHLEEAYEEQKVILNGMIDEINNGISDMEKKNLLKSNVSYVFTSNPSLKPEKIMIRSYDINRIDDIQLKHDKVQNEYNKFVLFSELYENENLDIAATPDDLEDVKQYIDNTVIPSFKVIPPIPPILMFLNSTSKAMEEYNKRVEAYQNSKKQYEIQLVKIRAEILPSESFNRLVDQFNEFVNIL